MKSKNLFGFLINPFTRIAGWQAFGIGLLCVVVMGVLGSFGGVAYDGVIDMHLMHLSLEKSLLFLGIDVAFLVLVMWITAMIVSKTYRFIDILGTMTLAKAPLIVLAIAGFFTTTPDMKAIYSDPYVIFSSVSFVVFMVLTMPIIVWNIALMYNALKVSCDVKGSKLTIAFIVALFVAEVLSKIVLYVIA